MKNLPSNVKRKKKRRASVSANQLYVSDVAIGIAFSMFHRHMLDLFDFCENFSYTIYWVLIFRPNGLYCIA